MITVLGFLIGIGVGWFIGKIMSRDSSSSRNTYDTLLEKYQSRIKDLEAQIEKLVVANQKHRASEKDSDEEIEDLEDDLMTAKKRIKELQEKIHQQETLILKLQ